MENKLKCVSFLGAIIVGYKQVDKIVVVLKEKGRFTRKLGVYGLEMLGENYIYYDTKGLLHILDTDYIKEIKCYQDNNYIDSIICNGV